MPERIVLADGGNLAVINDLVVAVCIALAAVVSPFAGQFCTAEKDRHYYLLKNKRGVYNANTDCANKSICTIVISIRVSNK